MYLLSVITYKPDKESVNIMMTHFTLWPQDKSIHDIEINNCQYKGSCSFQQNRILIYTRRLNVYAFWGLEMRLDVTHNMEIDKFISIDRIISLKMALLD